MNTSDDEDYYKNGTFPPIKKFNDKDNYYLAKMIKYVYGYLLIRQKKLEEKVNCIEEEVDEIKKGENIEEAINRGRKQLVKWVIILVTTMSAFFGMLQYIFGLLL